MAQHSKKIEKLSMKYSTEIMTILLLKMCQMGSVVFNRIMIIFITQNVLVHQSTRFDTLMPQSLDKEQLSRNSFSFVGDTPSKY